MENTEIANRQSSVPSVKQDLLSDFKGITPGFAATFASIRQKPVIEGDRITRKAGVWRFSDDRAEERPVLRAIILGTREGRTHFTPDGIPDCRSFDGSTPLEHIYSHSCDTCPMAKWTKNSTGGQEKPECQQKLNLLLVDDRKEVFIYSASSSHLKPTRDFLRAMIHQCGKDPRDYVIDIKIVEKQGKSYTWYMPVFPTLEEIKALQPIMNPETREAIQRIKDENMPLFHAATNMDDDAAGAPVQTTHYTPSANMEILPPDQSAGATPQQSAAAPKDPFAQLNF